MNIEEKNNLSEAAKSFKQNSFVKIERLIDPLNAQFLYEYVKLEALRLSTIEHSIDRNDPNYDKSLWGEFYDTQAPGDFSKYGDLTFDTVLAGVVKEVEHNTGLKLIPTYSYHRLYTNGTDLKRHRDRPSCEISATMCLGYNTSNLNNPNYNWPMFVKSGDKEIPITLNPGDAIIYRGCDIEHWREPFEGVNQAQVFLHYNEKEGNYNVKFDCRPALGLPLNYRNETEIDKVHKSSGLFDK